MSNIYIMGDVHGDFQRLNTFINDKKPKVIIICGDFGIWYENKEQRKWLHQDIKAPDTKIYFCDGNHENHTYLKNLRENNGNKKEPIEIHTNVFYCPRGTVCNIEGKNVMFFGGAYSVDRSHRIKDITYWEEEVITEEDMVDLPDIDIDVMITHTVPLKVKSFVTKDPSWKMEYYYDLKTKDQSCEFLDQIFEKYKPKEWYHGHFHFYRLYEQDGTNFTALGYLGQCDQKAYVKVDW